MGYRLEQDCNSKAAQTQHFANAQSIIARESGSSRVSRLAHQCLWQNIGPQQQLNVVAAITVPPAERSARHELAVPAAAQVAASSWAFADVGVNRNVPLLNATSHRVFSELFWRSACCLRSDVDRRGWGWHLHHVSSRKRARLVWQLGRFLGCCQRHNCADHSQRQSCAKPAESHGRYKRDAGRVARLMVDLVTLCTVVGD